MNKWIALDCAILRIAFILATIIALTATASAAPSVILWDNNYTNDQDIMFLVAQGSVINFNVITNEIIDTYTWQINKISQNNNANSFTWTVPSEKGIWEIHLKASNDNGEDHIEWVVSTLSIDEAPDNFEYFTDKKSQNRIDTDPWDRPLNDWTIDANAQNAFATGIVTNNKLYTPIKYGTWKFKYKFDAYHGFSGMSFVFLRTDSLGRVASFADATDSHLDDIIQYNGVFDAGYDGGGNSHTGTWVNITIIRTTDGWFYWYWNDMLNVIAWDNRDLPSEALSYSLTLDDMHFDCLEVYDHSYLFPDKGIVYESYTWNYDGNGAMRYYPNNDRQGIVIKKRAVTLEEISNKINDPSLFTYNSFTKTAIINTDLVVDEGAELIINDETLEFGCSYDGEYHFTQKYGSRVYVENSTITTTQDSYFIWNSAGSTTHFAVELKDSVWDKGYRYDPFPIEYSGYLRFIAKNSLINNTAHIFFDSPYELNITDTEFRNLHSVDIGTYDNYAGYAIEQQRRHARGDKSFWVFTDDLETMNFIMKNVTFTRADGSPLNVTFMINAHRDKINVYDMDLQNENILVKQSMAQTGPQSHSCYNDGPPYQWKSYIDTNIGIVNSKFNDLIIEPGVYTDSAGTPVKKEALIKYYLDVKVIDVKGNPVSNANIFVSNEIDDANYPSENAKSIQQYVDSGSPYDAIYHNYRFLDGETFNSATTNDDGHTPLPSNKEHTFVITDYKKDSSGKKEYTYTITAERDGITATVNNVNPDETWYRPDPNTPTKTITIVLPIDDPTYSVSGYTTYPNGTTIPNVTISNNITEQNTTTDASGYYIISNLANNTYNITASKPGFHDDYTIQIISGSDIENANIVLVKDTTSPTIIDINLPQITADSATITWTTTEASNSLVKYGTSPNSYTQNTSNPSSVTSHSITLNNLIPNTTYYYVIISTNPYGNSYQSVEYNFTTTSYNTPPEITGVQVTSLTTTCATIEWETEQNADTNITYATNEENLGTTWYNKSELTTLHSSTLTNLVENTSYYFKVYSTDPSGNTGCSSIYNFITAPVLSGNDTIIIVLDMHANRLREASSNTVYHDYEYIDLGRIGTTGNYRHIIWFNLSQFNSTDRIESATLSLFWEYESRNQSTTVQIYRPVEWYNNCNWNNQTYGIAWNNIGGDWFDRNNEVQGDAAFATVTFPADTTPTTAYYDFDVTEIVQSYIDGTTNNTGFFIRANEVDNTYISFYGVGWSNASQRPKLSITHTPEDETVNHAPVLNSIGDKSVSEGSLLQFTITATDPDNDTLTYSATNLPTGATFNSTTQTFSWTPVDGQAGIYTVHFEVTDGSLNDTEDVTIAVSGTAVEAEVTLTLYEGWNLIALPVINDSFTASSLASAIGDVSYVMKRNALDGSYQNYTVGISGDADDFVISPDEGYYVYLDVVQKDFTIRGTQPGTRSIELVEGWNLVGWTSQDQSNTVAAFVDPLGSEMEYAAKRNSPDGEYEYYVAGFSEPADNFDVEPGYGYFVYVTSSCTWVHD